jgi:hypothetical protein
VMGLSDRTTLTEMSPTSIAPTCPHIALTGDARTAGQNLPRENILDPGKLPMIMPAPARRGGSSPPQVVDVVPPSAYRGRIGPPPSNGAGKRDMSIFLPKS